MGKLQVKFRFPIVSEKLYELAYGEFGVLSPRIFSKGSLKSYPFVFGGTERIEKPELAIGGSGF